MPGGREANACLPVLECFQRNLAISTIDCGVVRVPVFETDERLDTPVTAQAGTAARVATPCAATAGIGGDLALRFHKSPTPLGAVQILGGSL
jgi:hypothetical protein